MIHGPLYDLIVSQEKERGWKRFVWPVMAGLLVWGYTAVSYTSFSFYPIIALSTAMWFLFELEAAHRVERMISTGFLRDYALAGSTPQDVAQDLNEGFKSTSAERLRVFEYVFLPPILFHVFANVLPDPLTGVMIMLAFGCFHYALPKVTRWRNPQTEPQCPTLGIKYAITKATGRRIIGKRIYRPAYHNFVGILLFTLGCLLWELVAFGVWLSVVAGWIVVAAVLENLHKKRSADVLPPAGEWEQFVELVEHAMGDVRRTQKGADAA